MSKSKILVVEDERITAEDLKNTLERLGYMVTGIASSAESFYKSIESEMPDLVLMDIYLKGNKDGIELASEIKQSLNIPVIYLTAFSDSNILDRAKVTGPFGYVLKPFQERELHSNIEMALHKNSMEIRINQLNTILKTIREINQITVRVKSIPELLQNTCDILISTRGFSSAWFITVDKEGHFVFAETAGIHQCLDSIKLQFQNGFKPQCIQILEADSGKLYSLRTHVDCDGCSLKEFYLHDDVIILKIKYQDSIFGYLGVSIPKSLINDEEELSLFAEISDDLGLALNNFEQQKRNEIADENLRDREEQYRTFMDSASDIAYLKDENLAYIMINRQQQEFFGMPNEEILGKTDVDLMPFEFAANCRKTDHAVLDTMCVVVEVEKQGDKYYETRKFPVKLKNGSIGIGAFIREITERIVLEEALKLKIADIKRFNNTMVDRELKMLELKKEINGLLLATGEKEKYKIVK
ncbi:MAG: response regulator [Bacteroidales bacterium]